MEKISKLIIQGDGEREIVYFDDMSFEQLGQTLKVYITKANQSKLLPLETEELKEKVYTNIHQVVEELLPSQEVEIKLVDKKKEMEYIQLPIESKRLLFKALDLPTEDNICHYCKEKVEFGKVSLMPAWDGSIGYVLCGSILCIAEYLEEESQHAEHGKD